MRFKLTLEVVADAYGTVLPISYQYDLSQVVRHIMYADQAGYQAWLSANGFTAEDDHHCNLYCISNLYVPRIYVQGSRLQINVPRVQMWISVYPGEGTAEFIQRTFLGQSLVIGDSISRVKFNITSVDIVSPVKYLPQMEYQTLAPLVVLGIRPNHSVEFLFPQNPYFAEFIVQELIERWEFLNCRPFTGNRSFKFELICPEKRKAVACSAAEISQPKVIGYMLKFRLTLDPQLQEIAYVCGVGDYVRHGFGYLELLDKSAD